MANDKPHYRVKAKQELQNEKEINHDAIKKQIKEFKKNGGKIQKIETGVSGMALPVHLTKKQALDKARNFKL